MGGSALKNHNVNPPRRQSLRLKGVRAIYEADSKRQAHEGNSSVATKIKVEVPELEECKSPCKLHDDVSGMKATNGGNTENCESKDTIQDSNYQSPRDITLKDLKARCKTKKQTVQTSATSTEADLKHNTNLDIPQKWNHAHVKPKEEEPDLDEPLITLKIKNSKTSSANRKRRRHSRLSSEYLDSVEGIDTCSHSSPTNAVPTSLPVETVKASDEDRLSLISAADLISTTDCAGEKLGVIAKQNLVETVKSLLPSATGLNRSFLHGGSPELSYNVKVEIMEAYSSNGQNKDDVTTSPSTDSIDNFQNSGNSFTGSPLKVSEGESDNGASASSKNKFLSSSANRVTEIAGPHNEKPELAYTVKKENLESDSSPYVNPFYIADSSTLDAIARFNYPERVTNDLLLRVDYASENTELTPLFNTHPYCSTNEASTEYPEVEEHPASDSVEEQVSEKRKINLSEMLSNKISPSLVVEYNTDPSDVCSFHSASATMVPDSHNGSSGGHSISEEVIHENSVNEMDSLAVIHSRAIVESSTIDVCASNKVSEKYDNITDEVLIQPLPICSHTEDAANDYSLQRKEVRKLGDMSSSSEVAEYCDKFVCGAVSKNVQTNANNSNMSHLGEISRKENYHVCSPLPSHTFQCAANNSDAIDNILVANDKDANFEEIFSSMIEQKLNKKKDKTMCDSGKNSKLNDVEGYTGAQNCPFPISPPRLNGFNYLGDSLPRAAKRLSSSSLPKKFHSITDQPTSSEISHFSDTEGNDIKKEVEHDHMSMAEQTPKKLLSQRKIISPTSQEKLCQALDDIDLHDATRIPDSRKRLWFRRSTGKKTSPISCSMEAEEFLVPERIMKRPKITRNGSLPPLAKGILKSPETSCKRPCSCMKSSSVHIQSMKAVEFSQRQMCDIENIATKLLRGLKSMKNIVEETLCSEASSNFSKFSLDEIRAEVENASELEKTTNKWLSMMTKDCNRFCKIMRSSENKAVTPVNGLRKERKKIFFADEVGGMLCHVKVFDQRPVSVVPESEV